MSLKQLRVTVLGLALAVAGLPALAEDYANPRLLTSTSQLERTIGQPDLRVVDVRPLNDYRNGHIPGAVHLGADDVIDPSGPVEGQLLPIDSLAAMLRERGIGSGTRVVLYDDKGGFHAARLFWMLEYFGHRDVSILNGGFPKWKSERRAVSRKTPQVGPASFAVALAARRVATADWLLERRDDPSVVVIDVRPSKMFETGHIPWARNISWKENLGAVATLKPADELLKHFAAHGVTPDKSIAVHCQSGKAAAHSYFTLRLLGYPRVRSYDRSWAEWGAADDLPKELGTQG